MVIINIKKKMLYYLRQPENVYNPVFNMNLNKKIMLIVVFIFCINLFVPLTSVSVVAKSDDVKISGVDNLPLTDWNVRRNDRIEVRARLLEYDWRIFGDDSWEPLKGCTLFLEVYDSKNTMVYNNSTIANFWTTNANFDIFRLNESGDYTAKVMYKGGEFLNPCSATFKIHVNGDSAPEYGDTKITGPDGLEVKTGDDVEIQARLYEYQELYFIDDYTRWHPLHGRFLDIKVVNSKGETVHTDRAITNLWTYNANFDVFKLNKSGDYICYINYTGNLKHSMRQFKIRVTPKD